MIFCLSLSLCNDLRYDLSKYEYFGQGKHAEIAPIVEMAWVTRLWSLALEYSLGYAVAIGNKNITRVDGLKVFLLQSVSSR